MDGNASSESIVAPLDGLFSPSTQVYYGKLEIAPPTGGAPASVDKAVLQDVTCIFGWFLPGNVGSVSDLPHLRWHMTPSAGYDKLIKSAYYQDLMDSTRNSDGDGDGDGQDDDKEKHYRRGHMVQLTTNSGVHCYVIPSYVLAMVVNLFIRVKENFENQISHQKWDRPQGFYARELAGSTFGIRESRGGHMYHPLHLLCFFRPS